LSSNDLNKMTHYSFKQIVQLTGLSQAMIRNWEARHNVQLSTRTQSGRRVFTESQYETLDLVKRLIDHEVKPSKIMNWLKAGESLRPMIEDLRLTSEHLEVKKRDLRPTQGSAIQMEYRDSDGSPYYIGNRTHDTDLTNCKATVTYHRLNSALDRFVGRNFKGHFLSEINDIFQRDFYLKQMSRMCVTVRHGLSNEIRTLESYQNESLQQNLTSSGFRCAVRPDSSLFTIGENQYRYCSSLQSVEDVFKKTGQPIQRTLAMVRSNGYQESLCFPFRYGLNHNQGFLYLNAGSAGGLIETLKFRALELDACLRICKIALSQVVFDISSEAERLKALHPAKTWNLNWFNLNTLQSILQELGLDLEIHCDSLKQDRLAKVSHGNLSLAILKVLNSFQPIFKNEFRVEIESKDTYLVGKVLFKNLTKFSCKAISMELQKAVEFLGFRLLVEHDTISLVGLTDSADMTNVSYTVSQAS